jgi:raffinose/stachyose/melibiose transport system permease protein
VNTKYTARTAVFEGLMIVLGALFMIPVYLLVVTAFKDPSDNTPAFEPTTHPTLANFVNAWQQGNIGGAFIDSVSVTVGSVLLLVLASSLAAYPLARVTKKWSQGAYLTFLFGLMLPIQLSMIPVYIALKQVGLTGNVFGLILVYGGIQMPFCIFLYTEFLRSVPKDYDESASIDGANRFQTFVHVLLPMLRPITGTVIILNAVTIWNDFYLPLLYLSGTQQQTLPVAIYSFVGQYAAQWPLVFAGLILAAIPILAAFLIMQKAVFRGYASGLKG